MSAKKPLGLYVGEIEGFHTGDFVGVDQGGTGAGDGPGARTALGLVIGTDVQAYNAQLASFAGLATVGIVGRSAANTVVARTLTGTAGNIVVSNGSGASGNPTFDLDVVTDAGGGSFRKFSRDTYGRITGMSAVVAADITALVDSVYGRAAVSGTPVTNISAAYTFVLADANTAKHHPAADTTARIWTIPANASVAYPPGTTLLLSNENAAGALTIAITTDTLRLVGAGTTGPRTLAANGLATLYKATATLWYISGSGLT